MLLLLLFFFVFFFHAFLILLPVFLVCCLLCCVIIVAWFCLSLLFSRKYYMPLYVLQRACTRSANFKARKRENMYAHTHITYEQINKCGDKEMKGKGKTQERHWLIQCGLWMHTRLLLSWRNIETCAARCVFVSVCVCVLACWLRNVYNHIIFSHAFASHVFTYMHVLRIASAKATSIFRNYYIWFGRFVSE